MYQVAIPISDGPVLDLVLTANTNYVFVGANGAGKTRLGVYIESKLPNEVVQRVGAQKSLSMRSDLEILSSDRALNGLRFGYHEANKEQKWAYRWGSKPATFQLSDFDALQQALFAEHNKVACEHYDNSLISAGANPPESKLVRLRKLWHKLLPHRELVCLDSKVLVKPDLAQDSSYHATDMSDGERVIFYHLGQALLAPENGVLIVDEPENHVHKALVGPLWDIVEYSRPDCCFIYFTHDLDFAAEQRARISFLVSSYTASPEAWKISQLGRESDIPERVFIEMIGARRPVLFIEGKKGSVDLTLYRCLYPEFVIYPAGSCNTVLHSVKSFNSRSGEHRIAAYGLVDLDSNLKEQIEYLNSNKVFVLPVAEVENLLLLPEVFVAIAKSLSCPNPEDVLEKLKLSVFEAARKQVDHVSRRRTILHLDSLLKKLELDSKAISPEELSASFKREIGKIDPESLYKDCHASFLKAIEENDYEKVLERFDNKGLLATAAAELGLKSVAALTSKLKVLLSDLSADKEILRLLKKRIPEIPLH